MCQEVDVVRGCACLRTTSPKEREANNCSASKDDDEEGKERIKEGDIWGSFAEGS